MIAMKRLLTPFLAAFFLLAIPSGAMAQGVATGDPINGPAVAERAVETSAANPRSRRATVKIHVGKLDNGRAPIMSTVPVFGSVAPFKRGQVVRVSYFLNGRKLFSKKAKVRPAKGGRGAFVSRIRLKRGGKYAASAKVRAIRRLRSDETVRKSWKVSYKAVGRGECSNVVAGFKKAMRRLGYPAGDGKCFTGKTGRSVLAFRKVNNMSRIEHAGKAIVKQAFMGQGGYKVRYPKAGKHVETSLSKQILVFADGTKIEAVYPISSGAPSTPTVQGHFEFGTYTQPGYNNLEMYYSYYFYGGYAVHGYHSVPDYPASHGCLRTFIADQPEIFKRIYPGLDIFVF